MQEVDYQKYFTPKTTKYHYGTPTVKQTAALLMNNVYELLFGGSAGGGKSYYMLYAALQYVDVPGYSAILFRKTFADLMLPGALIPMAKEWLSQFPEVKWYEKDHRFVFTDTGATLSFGYLDARDDHLRYQGAEFQFIGFDEVTHIAPEQYSYLQSRLRKKKSIDVPLRIRATANPGGTYGDYYYSRFFLEPAADDGFPKRVFLQSKLDDNPYLDAAEYRRALSELDPVTRAQLEDGDWEIRASGDLFQRDWIAAVQPTLIPANAQYVRCWDLAAIDPKRSPTKRGADYTVGVKMASDGKDFYICDIVRTQQKPGEVEDLIAATAAADGKRVAIRIEEEGGSSGKKSTEVFAARLAGYDFVGVHPTASKADRARPFAAAAQRGNVYVLTTCRYITDLFAELEAFPCGAHDDMVDACTAAYNYFIGRRAFTLPVQPAKSTQYVYRRGTSYWRACG